MIRTAKVLYCEEEHGVGDITFPALGDVDPMRDVNAVELRRRAKAAGWVRVHGADYCDGCAANISPKTGKGRA